MSRISRSPPLFGPQLEQAIRAATPLAAVREIVRRTRGLGATVQVGADATHRVGLIELLRLGSLETGFAVTTMHTDGQSTAELIGPEGSVELAPADLDHPLGPSFIDGVADVCTWQHVGALAFLFAGEVGKLRREVDELTRHDQATGLLNRREFEARFGHERSRVVRQRGALSVIFVEVDSEDGEPYSRPSRISIESAQAAQDSRMKPAATVLKAELRAHDVAARFDEGTLVVVLPGAGSLEVALVARRIGQAAVRKGTSVSIGGASFPDDTDHPDDLVQLAEKSLAEARRAGGARAWLCGADEAILFEEAEG